MADLDCGDWWEGTDWKGEGDARTEELAVPV